MHLVNNSNPQMNKYAFLCRNPHMYTKFKYIRLVTGALPVYIWGVQLVRLHLGVVQH
jgi:hypothetical protein